MKKYDINTIEHITDHINNMLIEASEETDRWRNAVDEERTSQFGNANEKLYNDHYQRSFGAELVLGQLLDELADLQEALDIVERF